MRKYIASLSLAQQALLWLLPPIVLALSLAAGLELYLNYERLQKSAEAETERLAEQTELLIKHPLVNMHEQLYLLADNDLVQAGLVDEQERHRYLPTLLRTYGSLPDTNLKAHLAFLDFQGQPLLTNQSASLQVSKPVSVPQGTEVPASTQTYWSSQGLNLRVPVYLYEFVEGALSYSLDLATLKTWFTRFDGLNQGVALYGADDRLLANQAYQRQMSEQQALLIHEKPFELPGLLEASLPLTLVITLPEEDFFAAHRNSYRDILLVLVMTLLLVTSFLLLGIRWITRPVRFLDEQLQELAAAPDIRKRLELHASSRELSNLVDTVNQALDAIDRLHHRQMHLEQDRAFNYQIKKLTQNLPGVLYQYQLWPDGHSRFVYASEGLEAIYGVSPEEVKETADKVFAAIHPEDREEVVVSIQQSAQNLTEWAAEYRACLPGGQTVWLAGQAQPELKADGSVLWHGYIQDITERKLYQAAVTESELRFRQFAENTDLAFWIRDQKDILYVNPAYQKISGCSLQSLYDDPYSFAKLIHPEDYNWVLEEMQETENQGYSFDATYRIIRPDGQLRWVHVKTHPVRDEQSEIIRVTGIAQDVTRQVDVEQALQASNQELEQFAYVASHDLRQPLRMINSYLQLLERRLDKQLDEDARTMMNFARGGAQRLDQMLVSLLEFSRVGRKGEPMQPLSSFAAVEEALAFLKPQMDETSAEVQVPEASVWPEVYASRDELTRLFQNLVGNAIKYTRPEERPKIRLEVTRKGEFWRFAVEDQGIGIDPNQFDRLFKVFQRLQTRDQYEGSGIGLAVARKIVERHGGEIWVESSGEGHGSTFYFTLPVLQES
ncbi:PAS domain-containing protein [Marinospirillum sp.]|uniref:PAS domain-containing sensor histidine kinase n=1 Tax=Marinospirillum sp. TaxID=2183934 RepID=UPI002870903E|nr:PAS domain-containing protein [Marinospirillum sp.]MDR9467234.1 PAS domain-containing protein [Marinospirillum sp.]